MTELKEFKPNIQVRLIKDKYHLVNLKTLLNVAKRKKFGVMAVNVRGRKEIVYSVLEAAFSEKSPIIIQIAESEVIYTDAPLQKISDYTMECLGELLDKYGYMIPVCLHLDHLQKNLSLVDSAIKSGFSSILCDQSKKSLRENIEITKKQVEKCHPLGISVEGELGEIQEAKVLAEKNLTEDNIVNYIPKIEDALRFVKETGIDAFAMFFGNAHGKYERTPVIAWDKMEEVHRILEERNLDIPLVLHGSSYLYTKDFNEKEVFKQAIKRGCYKFNYSTRVADIFKEYLPKDLQNKMESYTENPDNWRKSLGKFRKEIDSVDSKIIKRAQKAMAEHVRIMIRDAFGSNDKLKFYNREDFEV